MSEPHDIQAVRNGVLHQVRVAKEKSGWRVTAYPLDGSGTLVNVGWLLADSDGYLLEREMRDDLRGAYWDPLIREGL